MIDQIYQFGGVDTRTNVLTRSKVKASDALNVELDQNGYLRKRKGFEALPATENELTPTQTVFTYKRGGETTLFTPVDLVFTNLTSVYLTVVFNPIRGTVAPTTAALTGTGTALDPYLVIFRFYYAENIGVIYGGPTHQQMIDAVAANAAIVPLLSVASTNTAAKTFGDFPEFMIPSPPALADFYQLIDFAPREGEDRLLCLTSDGTGSGVLAPTVEHPYWVVIPSGAADGNSVFTTGKDTPFNVSVYDGIVYLADPDGIDPLLKMDGTSFYRAGVIQPNASILSSIGGAGTRYLRVHYEFTDYKDRTFSGDFLDLGTVLQGSTTTLAYRTFLNPVGHVGGIDPRAFNTGDIDKSGVNTGTFGPCKLVAVLSMSENIFFGFKVIDRSTIDYNVSGIVNSNVAYTTTIAAADISLTETYDDTIRKGLPPKGKHITIYNNLMVLGNFEEVEIADSGAKADSIIWSDLSTGGTVEAFPSLNAQDIGKSSREIAGLFGDSDNLNVFKKNNLFFVSGDLVNGNYRVRDSLSEGIGCISSKSIAKVEGGCVFMSSRGLYFAQDGYKPIEFSDEIQALFDKSVLDLSRTISTTDHQQEKLLFFVPFIGQNDGKIFQYDYYHKQWFILDSIGDYRGITIHDDELYHVTDAGIMVRNSGNSDNGTAIAAHYSTHWFNLGAPSVNKKFTNLVLLSVGSKIFDLALAIQRNWKETDISTTTLNFIADTTSEDTSLPATQSKSMRFIFSNAILDEDIELNGYEYEYEGTQTRFKGGD